ncbi:transposase, partial [Mesorhizobium sp. M1322]|uniref:IS256 family transposase n=1 Tax=Mesorhizobium sp. M1322 TaxID=2957081 RepID=UPI003336E904
MTNRDVRLSRGELKALLLSDEDGFRQALQSVVQEVLEAEMTEAIGAEKGERTAERTSYRSGYYERKLVTRVGVLELRVPQDRAGRFSTELFERYQRSEKALVSALVEMYVQGVSTRKVKAVTEELCGHSFSASTVSEATMRLDEALKAFFTQRLEESYPYLILDARYERAREAGVIASQAVLVAIGVDWCRCRLNTPQKCRLNLPQYSAAAGLPERAPGDRRRVIVDASPDGRERDFGDQDRGDDDDTGFASAGPV